MKRAQTPSLKSVLFFLTAAAVATGLVLIRNSGKKEDMQHSHDQLGRLADVPEEIPRRGLINVMGRVLTEIRKDRVTLIAGGVTFYILLALFSALVSLYGLVADPTTIA